MVNLVALQGRILLTGAVHHTGAESAVRQPSANGGSRLLLIRLHEVAFHQALSRMLRATLDLIAESGCKGHLRLGPFEAYASSGTLPDMALRETQPRLPVENFNYAEEDEVYAAATRDRFT